MPLLSKTKSLPTFIDLPKDILTECLMSLDDQDLLKCKQICSSIRSLIDTDIRLQYMIELYANNMVHNPRLERPEPLYLRLKRLAEHQRCHRNPRIEKIDSFTQTTAFPPNDDGREISGAIEGGIIVVWTKLGSFVRFTQIPSQNLGIQSSQYDLRLVNGRIVQLTFDPAQELVVVLETTTVNKQVDHSRLIDKINVKFQSLTCLLVSVRSLLTGEKHPMAAKLVCWLEDSDIPFDELLIGVYGDHVALIIRQIQAMDDFTKVIVFNWKTSNMIHNICRECILEGYEWLTERYLLLVETHSNPTAALALTIVDILNPDHPVICTLNFPRMVESAFEFDSGVQICSHPSSQGTLSQTEVPFFSNPENKLVLVSFYAHHFGGIIVAALASDLLKIARENTCEGSISIIAWDDWGTTHTRVIQPRVEGRPHISVYGTRALVQDTNGKLSLYDFNLKLILRDPASQATDPAGKVVIHPTVVHNERLFINEVKTCLPYRIVDIPRPKGMSSARTCELCIDGLIFVPGSVAGDDNIDIYSFR